MISVNPNCLAYLIMWWLVDGFYSSVFTRDGVAASNVDCTVSDWSELLSNHVRQNMSVAESAKSVVNRLHSDLYPIQDFNEFCDVANLFGVVDPDFIQTSIQSLPN